MRWVYAALCTCTLMSAAAIAETPEAVAEQYFERLRAQDWEQVTELFDPQALADFHETFSWMHELDDEDFDNAAAQIFGAGTTKESLADMSDSEFFSHIIEAAMGRAAQIGQLDFKQIEILGAVPEGDDVSHVVARFQIDVGEVNVEAMEVISLRKSDQGWRILMQGKMKGMAEQLRKALQRRETRPPRE